MTPILAVFDCTTFAQALINPKGPAGACLAAAQAGFVKLFVTDFVVYEIRGLAAKLPAKLAVSANRVESLILDLAKYSEPVEHVTHVFRYDRDPDDAHYVNLALEVRAPYIITRDNDLLDLMNDSDFGRRFPELHIVAPPALLLELKRQQAGGA